MHERITLTFIQPRSRYSGLTAYLLCLFFGNFGIHRFYTNRIGTGLLMLFTGGGFGIWTIIDLIMLSTNQFQDNSGITLQFTNADGTWPTPALIATTLILAFIGASLLGVGAAGATAGSFSSLFTSAMTRAAINMSLEIVLGIAAIACSMSLLGTVLKRCFSDNTPENQNTYPSTNPTIQVIDIHRNLGIDPRNTLDQPPAYHADLNPNPEAPTMPATDEPFVQRSRLRYR